MKFQQQYTQCQQQKQKQNQTQKLALTQQLQQSIQILHYSTEELRAFIENETLENPLIELVESVEPTDSNLNEYAKTYTHETADYLTHSPGTSYSIIKTRIAPSHLNYSDTELRTLVLFLVEDIDLNGFLKLQVDTLG